MLKITFNERFTITAKWYPKTQLEKENMTIDLTSMDSNGTPLRPRDFLSSPSTRYRAAWINWSSGPLNSIYISSRMLYKSNIIEYVGINQSDELSMGWNQLMLKGTHLGYHAP
jgi:hypothetical protein